MTLKPLDKDQLARILQWGAGGGAAALVTVLATNPDLVQKVLANWPGAIFGIVCVGFVLLDRRAGQGITALREMADANKGLTEAVKAQAASIASIARRDDEQALRHEALLEETADRTRRILQWIEREEDRRAAKGIGG